MKEQLISFETAKLAKEKGFNIIQRYGTESSLYDKDGKHVYYSNYGFMYSGLSDGYISAPTQSLLQKWLREVHNIQVTVTYWGKEVRKLCNHSCYECIIHKDDISVTSYYSNSYEEALEEGLKQALQLIN